jgi:hypothetical protein
MDRTGRALILSVYAINTPPPSILRSQGLAMGVSHLLLHRLLGRREPALPVGGLDPALPRRPQYSLPGSSIRLTQTGLSSDHASFLVPRVAPPSTAGTLRRSSHVRRRQSGPASDRSARTRIVRVPDRRAVPWPWNRASAPSTVDHDRTRWIATTSRRTRASLKPWRLRGPRSS